LELKYLFAFIEGLNITRFTENCCYLYFR